MPFIHSLNCILSFYLFNFCLISVDSFESDLIYQTLFTVMLIYLCYLSDVNHDMRMSDGMNKATTYLVRGPEIGNYSCYVLLADMTSLFYICQRNSVKFPILSIFEGDSNGTKVINFQPQSSLDDTMP